MNTFNIKEVSEYLHCSVSLIRKMVANKEIPYFRMGNRLYFKKEIIDTWINNKCIYEVNKTQREGYIE